MQNHCFLHFFRQVFSEYTEASVTTSLIPIHAILAEICAFIIGYTSLADCVLANAILIPPRLPIPPTTIKKGRVFEKSTELVTEKLYTSK